MSRLFVILTVCAISVIGVVACRTTASEELEPLVEVSLSENALETVPLVSENGRLRQMGIISLVVSPDFNTGQIRKLNADAELWRDDANAVGERFLIIRAPDESLDELISKLRGQPGVVSGPDKSYVFKIHQE